MLDSSGSFLHRCIFPISKQPHNMLYPFSDPVQLLFCFVCPSASAEDQIIQRNMKIIRKLCEELNGASSDSAFDPPKMYIRDVQVLSKCLLGQSVLYAELPDHW